MDQAYFDQQMALLAQKSIAGKFTFANRKTASLEYVLQHKLAQNPGLWLEFGVFKGHTINMIADFCPKVYGFDSFEGFPDDQRSDWSTDRFDQAGNLPAVKANVELIQGYFDGTLPAFLQQHPEPAAFIHIDCDIYSSTVTVLNLLKDRLVPGTVIVFDELLHYAGFEQHEWKAWYEFVQANNIDFEWLAIKDKVMTYQQYAEFVQTLPQNSAQPDMKVFRNLGYEQEVALIIR